MILTWSGSTDNVAVSGYDVYKDGIKLNSTPITGTTYNATGLTAGTSYTFYVQARDAAGNNTNSSPLNVATASPPDTEAPSTPTNLAVSGNVHASVTLVWDASTDNIAVSGYDVYQNNIKINTMLIAGTTYTAGNLAALTQYSFYVVAKDGGGNTSANSDPVNITTPDTEAPSAPANLVAQDITATNATLTWNPSSDNVAVTGYDVYQNGIKINAAPLAENTITVSNLSEGTPYNFFVKAIDAGGNTSTSSNILNVLTLDVQAPAAPTGLASSSLTATSVTLNWTASSDNVGVAGYDVYKNGIKANATPITATSYNATGLTPSTAYSFYVQAKDAAGNLSASSIATVVTTPAAPGCSGTGFVNYAKWNNVTGSTVASLTSLASYPNTPSVTGTLSSLEIPANSGDNYGIKVFGYLCPPTTGSYTFWIAGDDNCELWLSTSGNAAGKQKIAFHTSYTNAQEWNKFTTQKSAAIVLNSGQLYYIEALLKEGTGGDNMAVGWAKPGQATTVPSEVIPGSQLVADIADVQAPTAPLNLRAAETMQTTISLNWMAATDNVNVAGYDVYNSNNVKINASTISTLSYTVPGLTPSTQYNFYVRAKDAAGNVSGNSNTVTASTVMLKPAIENFTQRTVIANQRMPHDLVYGPDNNLWYTERFGGTVSFVNPATGAKKVVLALGANMVRTGGQDGLMGLALHPQFKAGKPYVYISYTYQSTSNTVRKTRIARYTYDSATQNLISPVTIIENIPGSNDHNSARLAIGPDLRLYYSIGDMGAGQFDNLARTQNAQNLNVLEGKILRLNTEPVNNSWIPSDNPFTNAGVVSPVYSLGHRNPQGLVWGNVNNTPILYSSEHGPYSDDELNIIEQGRNYGWPAVAGFCDGNYNGRFLGGAITQSEQNSCATLNMKEPLRSLFPVVRPPDSTTSNLTWPSTAPSGMDFYSNAAIPGWQNSLLVAQLKAGTIARFKLSSDGQFIISDTINYFRGKGRFRDVVVSSDGLKIYVACDSSGSTSGPTGGVTSTPANPGSILEFTYQSTGIAARTNASADNQMADAVNDKTIDIYPNPASAYIIVYNHSGAEGRSVTLTDLNGRMIQRQLLRNRATRIETGSLANGLYLVTIRDAGNNTLRSEKIMVQR
jgi:PQQ-dependent dehydrogenase (s-GDH family)